MEDSGAASANEDRPAPRRSSALRIFGRHQLSSALATAIDYLVMIVCVSALRLSPVVGTFIGASTGAATNFTLNRYFTFHARHRRPEGQAFRYLLVSALSAAWNALGVHVLAVELGMQYVVARVIVGTVVGVVWNFPLHRYFVFR